MQQKKTNMRFGVLGYDTCSERKAEVWRSYRVGIGLVILRSGKNRLSSEVMKDNVLRRRRWDPGQRARNGSTNTSERADNDDEVMLRLLVLPSMRGGE